MVGTSLDGVDAAIITTDGERVTRFGPAERLPFTAKERGVLIAATQDTVRVDGYVGRPDSFAETEAAILDVHVPAAEIVRGRENGGAIDLVGFHGQTVLHRPDRRSTIQLGDPGALGAPVVADLRQADLAAGGQGAPLVPVYHAVLADVIGVRRPLPFLNVGGVANLSWLGPDGAMVAFGTGSRQRPDRPDGPGARRRPIR